MLSTIAILKDHSCLRFWMRSPILRTILSTSLPGNGQEPSASTRSAPRLIFLTTMDLISTCTDSGRTENKPINAITPHSVKISPIISNCFHHPFWVGWIRTTLVFILLPPLSESMSLRSTEPAGMLREPTSLYKIMRTNISHKSKLSIKNMIWCQPSRKEESSQAILRPTLLLKFRLHSPLPSMPQRILSDWNATELTVSPIFSELIYALILATILLPANVIKKKVTHVMPPRMSPSLSMFRHEWKLGGGKFDFSSKFDNLFFFEKIIFLLYVTDYFFLKKTQRNSNLRI